MQSSTCRLVRGSTPAAAKAQQRVYPRAIALKHVSRASCKDEHQTSPLMQQITAFAASAAITATLALNPLPAAAELVQTVPVGQMTQMARALPKQEIDKGKVWTVFIGGAASLFILTVAAENNKSWFPAISRANAAMAEARKRAEKAEANPPPADIYTSAGPAPRSAPVEPELPPLDLESAALEAEIERRNALAEAEAEQAEIERQSKLVEEGLLAARKKVLDTPEKPAAAATAAAEVSSSSSSGIGEAGAAIDDSSSHSSNGSSAAGSSTSTSTSGDASVAGYTVVAESSAVPAEVAWQGATVQPAAAAADNSSPQAVPPAALTGVLESRELMQQYKEQQKQQKQQQQQQQEVRS